MDKPVLTAALAAEFNKVNYVEQTGSTNADLLESSFSSAGPAGPALLWAAHQTAGRGRRGAVWLDQIGSSLTFSIALERPVAGAAALSAFSLVTALVVARRLELAMPWLAGRVQLKWPNDVLLNHCKAVGILCEAKMHGATERLVIGCGINLVTPAHLQVDPGSLSPIGLLNDSANWTDEDSQQLIADIALTLKSAFERFTTAGFDDFRSDWARFDAFANQWVELRENGRVIASGLCCGVDSSGALCVESDGIIEAYSIGVVSARSGTAPVR